MVRILPAGHCGILKVGEEAKKNLEIFPRSFVCIFLDGCMMLEIVDMKSCTESYISQIINIIIKQMDNWRSANG